MRRFSNVAFGLALALGLAAPSLAQTGAGEAPNGAGSRNADATVLKTAAAPLSARAAAMVHSYQSDPALTLRRNKGIQSIRRLSAGVYCLKPVGRIKAKEAVASVSVNWIASYGDNLLATIAAPSYECEGKEFEVRTFKFAPGASFLASDEVSFTIVVP